MPILAMYYITNFIVSAVRDAAQKTIEQAELIRLTRADQACFAQALLALPQPTSCYKKSFRSPPQITKH